MRVSLSLLNMLIVALSLSSQSATPVPPVPLREHIVAQDRNGDAVVKIPLPPGSIGEPAERLGRLGLVPIGVEDCREPMPPMSEPAREFVLTGMRVGQALDRLVQFDPRYKWQEVGGVIVVRPIEAWNDAANPLNRFIGSLQWDNVTLSEVLDRAVTVVTGETYHTVASSMDDRQFNVEIANATVLDLLNTIVRAHGDLAWHVGYRASGSLREFGIGFHAFAGHGRWLWIPETRIRRGH